MDTREIEVQELTQSRFKPFGKVLSRPEGEEPAVSRKDLLQKVIRFFQKRIYRLFILYLLLSLYLKVFG
ncbi:hypothetical protein ES702_03722 [subsurface metagenome]